MGEIKLILTDIDGTLVPPATHEVSNVVYRAIYDVKNRGVAVTPVTGRPHEMAKGVLHTLGVKDLGIFDGGASIQDIRTGEIIWKKWLPADLVAKAVEIILPHSVAMNYQSGLHVTEAQYIKVININEAPYVFGLVRKETVESIMQELREIPEISAHTGPGLLHKYPDCVDIQVTHKNADKFHGIQALRKIVYSTEDNTLAIGDGNNDIPLFKGANFKVAMGNAPNRLKELADYIAAPVEQNGFAEAMHQFILKSPS